MVDGMGVLLTAPDLVFDGAAHAVLMVDGPVLIVDGVLSDGESRSTIFRWRFVPNTTLPSTHRSSIHPLAIQRFLSEWAHL